jgi:hypothetical protein
MEALSNGSLPATSTSRADVSGDRARQRAARGPQGSGYQQGEHLLRGGEAPNRLLTPGRHDAVLHRPGAVRTSPSPRRLLSSPGPMTRPCVPAAAAPVGSSSSADGWRLERVQQTHARAGEVGVLRLTCVRLRTRAVAASRPSIAGRGPVAFSRPHSSAMSAVTRTRRSAWSRRRVANQAPYTPACRGSRRRSRSTPSRISSGTRTLRNSSSARPVASHTRRWV